MPITLAPRVWAEEIGAALHDETLRTLSATRHGFSTPVFHNDCAPRERRDTGNNDSKVAGTECGTGHFVCAELVDDHHDQVARAVHALDADQLDVGGRGATGNHGGRLLRIDAADHLRHAVDQGIGAHDHHVAVGHE